MGVSPVLQMDRCFEEALSAEDATSCRFKRKQMILPLLFSLQQQKKKHNEGEKRNRMANE